MTTPESRARLGYLLSEMLSLPELPAELSRVINDHLQQQLSLVNILKPEYCLRLYPVLAELAELNAKAAESQAPAEHVEAASNEAPAPAIAESTSDEAPAETVNGSTYTFRLGFNREEHEE
jgi:hypothetical protein